jgi:hypothetical protein
MRGHQMSEWAKEAMCDERAGRDDDLERKLAQLSEEFDPVPSSVVDAARAAWSELARPDRTVQSPDHASADEDPASEDRDPVPNPRRS